jgi:hypothetical protein
MWARQFLTDLGFPQLAPTPIAQDNLSTISIVDNGNDHGRTRHMDIRFHYIRACVDSGDIITSYLPTAEMISDTLSKNLPPSSFTTHRTGILGVQFAGGWW